MNVTVRNVQYFWKVECDNSEIVFGQEIDMYVRTYISLCTKLQEEMIGRSINHERG